MMTKLVRKMDSLVDDELAMANNQHGFFFKNSAEAWGVIEEEYEEAEDKVGILEIALQKWKYKVRTEDASREEDLQAIKEKAIYGACELVQVAAMAEKEIKSMKQRGECR